MASSVMARALVCDAVSQNEVQVRNCSAVALICCSINAATKPVPAKKKSSSVLMSWKSRLLRCVSEELLIHSKHVKGNYHK